MKNLSLSGCLSAQSGVFYSGGSNKPGPDFEKNVFYQNCPQHLQGEDKSSFSWEQTGQLLVRDEVKYSDVADASTVFMLLSFTVSFG